MALHGGLRFLVLSNNPAEGKGKVSGMSENFGSGRIELPAFGFVQTALPCPAGGCKEKQTGDQGNF